MPSKRTARFLLLGVLAATTMTLSGCSEFLPLPDEERYQYINEAKDALDLGSAGEVVEESYDRNDGVFSPSYYEATIKGENAFEILAPRVQEIITYPCGVFDEGRALRCIQGRPTISMVNNNGMVNVSITDSFNGREVE